MGKDNRSGRSTRQVLEKEFGKQRRTSQVPEPQELTSRPFQAPLRGVKAGPLCLVCSKAIDTRGGSSVSSPRGSRVAQRQGFMHADCLGEEEAKYHKVEFVKLASGQLVQNVLINRGLALPVYAEEELDEAIEFGCKSLTSAPLGKP